jgi:hypothetical protein
VKRRGIGQEARALPRPWAKWVSPYAGRTEVIMSGRYCSRRPRGDSAEPAGAFF